MNKIIEELKSIQHKTDKKIPSRNEIINIIKLTQAILFNDVYKYEGCSCVNELYELLKTKLSSQIDIAFKYISKKDYNIDELTLIYLSKLVETKRILLTDIEAIYNGDPSCLHKEEVILCYPGFYAICIYRISHILYELNIPFIPRIMGEYAHEKTGIDINPGAKIGEYFCIDHGTGIVIGETAVIGNNVKLYQGVTLGAKSFSLDNNGHPIKGGKRHPTIGNNVVIYANATILGGDTIIGDNCVIGGNTWIITSISNGKKVFYK